MSDDSDDDAYIVNPEAVGDPDQTPILHCSLDLVRLLNPCRRILPSGDWCGGVNGHHHDQCSVAAS